MVSQKNSGYTNVGEKNLDWFPLPKLMNNFSLIFNTDVQRGLGGWMSHLSQPR